MHLPLAPIFLLASHSAAASTAPGPIRSSQELVGDVFIGAPATAHPLRKDLRFQPDTVALHGNGGNTDVTDYSAPLGANSITNSTAQSLGTMFWGSDGSLTALAANITGSVVRLGIAAYDTETLEAIGTWFPEDASQTVSPAYIEMRLEDNTLIVPTRQGRIYLVQRQQTINGTVQLAQQREIDLAAQGVLAPGESLFSTLFDTAGNIWFTTGGLMVSGDSAGPSSTIGYIEPDGTIHTLYIADQIIENGFAVNQTTAFVVTGPTISNTTDPSSGYVLALEAVPGTGVGTVWNATYDAGSGLKPGGLSRGSGTTPVLLGADYVAITDNADGRVNLVILHQDGGGSGQVFCTVPLFEEDASAVEVAPVVHFDGETYGVMLANWFDAPVILGPTAPLDNGPTNNMSGMAGGMVRVDVAASGCAVRWELAPEKIKTVPVLSTATGLVYGYLQDEELARDGQYTWYFIAIDWESGALVWKVRAGAGQTFNDNSYPAFVGSNGKVYQAVWGGTVWLEDLALTA